MRIALRTPKCARRGEVLGPWASIGLILMGRETPVPLAGKRINNLLGAAEGQKLRNPAVYQAGSSWSHTLLSKHFCCSPKNGGRTSESLTRQSRMLSCAVVAERLAKTLTRHWTENFYSHMACLIDDGVPGEKSILAKPVEYV